MLKANAQFQKNRWGGVTMYSLTYVSTSSVVMFEEDLDALLEESRLWNAGHSLTGLLLYQNGFFMQFLEGEKEEVLNLMHKIRKDPRHHSIIIILQQEQEERLFGEWSMGFARLDQKIEGRAPVGFTNLWELPFNSEEFLTNPTSSLSLLRSFKDSIALSLPRASTA